MKVTRREFFKISGAAVATLPVLGFDLTPAMAQVGDYRIKNVQPVPTICPYCGCGCGLVVYAADGKVLSTEGDPDHPINQGATCAKGASVFQLHDNPRRMTKPLYRAPYSDHWEEKDWDWVLNEIAQRIKKTRDETFITTEKVKTRDETGAEREIEITVNRTDAIATLGGAALDNEECYLYSKLARSLGIVYVEHCARL
ncbi:MAG: formate dehydrogenase major subunit [Thermacetogenium sp.]|uniref:Formate dehydrogenase subunit alpha n=1 Tax=Thermacetogenium phaeum TaxID=85874 RepID=A0A101FGM7_9THEO|nr:MAG: Formate dehydrogenase subunit alpha [Thermacetogenium phaeum]MDN5364928.1 formate dehydrogenase major subunit [Thermacetogenium sp.]